MILYGCKKENIEIDILKRSYPDTNDFWDGNWLDIEIKIIVPGFTGNYDIYVRIPELIQFHKDLLLVINLAASKAEFITMENGLHIVCERNTLGQVTCHGIATAIDLPGHNRLEFEFRTDVISLKNFARDLKLMLNIYPAIEQKVNPD